MQSITSFEHQVFWYLIVLGFTAPFLSFLVWKRRGTWLGASILCAGLGILLCVYSFTLTQSTFVSPDVFANTKQRLLNLGLLFGAFPSVLRLLLQWVSGLRKSRE